MTMPANQPEDETGGGLTVLECAVLGLAIGAALYVGWSAWQQWRHERAQRPVIDAEATEVGAPAPSANGVTAPVPLEPQGVSGAG